MYRKVLVESASLTPELAARFAAMTPLPGERLLRSTRRQYLEAQLLRGKFSGPDWASGRCLSTDTIYRLDGQHSSDLLTHLPGGAEFPTGLIATITHYEFDSMGDAADVFNLFNNPRSVRNNLDMMGTYAAQIPELEMYSREFMVNVGNGIYEYEKKRHQGKARDAILLGPRDRGLYFMFTNRPEFVTYAHWLADFRDLRNGKAFLPKPVIVAEMIAHRVQAPQTADEFWRLVFAQSHPDPDHETKVLAEWFRETLAVAAKPRLDMSAFRRKMSRAWRSFKTAEQAAA